MVAVQASRLSTGLHQLGKPGEVQESSKFRGCVDTFFGSGMRDSALAPYTLTSVVRHVSVPLVSLSAYLDVRMRFFSFFSCET